jgi:hypothetical protein
MEVIFRSGRALSIIVWQLVVWERAKVYNAHSLRHIKEDVLCQVPCYLRALYLVESVHTFTKSVCKQPVTTPHYDWASKSRLPRTSNDLHSCLSCFKPSCLHLISCSSGVARSLCDLLTYPHWCMVYRSMNVALNGEPCRHGMEAQAQVLMVCQQAEESTII